MSDNMRDYQDKRRRIKRWIKSVIKFNKKNRDSTRWKRRQHKIIDNGSTDSEIKEIFYLGVPKMPYLSKLDKMCNRKSKQTRIQEWIQSVNDSAPKKSPSCRRRNFSQRFSNTRKVPKWGSGIIHTHRSELGSEVNEFHANSVDQSVLDTSKVLNIPCDEDIILD